MCINLCGENIDQLLVQSVWLCLTELHPFRIKFSLWTDTVICCKVALDCTMNVVSVIVLGAGLKLPLKLAIASL
jgi:hypothetical protein